MWFILVIGCCQELTEAIPCHPQKRYRAVYDYSAADEDEVSFVDGDVIVDVQQIDEGWMYGCVERTGQRGMLPANYVEAIWARGKEKEGEKKEEEEVEKGRERRKGKAQCHLILTQLSLDFTLVP